MLEIIERVVLSVEFYRTNIFVCRAVVFGLDGQALPVFQMQLCLLE